MAHNVFAIYDNNDGKLYQFAALETTLAKDAVLAFMEENSSALFGGGSSQNTKESCMTQISKTDSIESLIEALNAWDFNFNLIQIAN